MRDALWFAFGGAAALVSAWWAGLGSPSTPASKGSRVSPPCPYCGDSLMPVEVVPLDADGWKFDRAEYYCGCGDELYYFASKAGKTAPLDEVA